MQYKLGHLATTHMQVISSKELHYEICHDTFAMHERYERHHTISDDVLIERKLHYKLECYYDYTSIYYIATCMHYL